MTRQGSASATILMFSGGRDSTLAAVRLASRAIPLYLVTVSSTHLVGLDRVHRRLRELKPYLPLSTRWINVVQPENLPGGSELMARTCLPCHRAYTAIGATFAKQFGVGSLAFGYTSYQSMWPEQGPSAVGRLQTLLASEGISLSLPVYDLAYKANALAELERLNLSTGALEQKCLQQVSNVLLDQDRLEQELAKWEAMLRRTLAALETIQLRILADARLSALVCRTDIGSLVAGVPD